jgi:hypothetical protein
MSDPALPARARSIGFRFMPSASALQPPICEQCDAAMKFVGKLPSVQHRPEVRVFRCTSCNHIASVEV